MCAVDILEHVMCFLSWLQVCGLHTAVLVYDDKKRVGQLVAYCTLW